MSIELHCHHCGQKIRAPTEAAGRWGTCPKCQQKVYIPTPADEGEEIGLAPIDEQEERRTQRQRARFQDVDQQFREGRRAEPEADAAIPTPGLPAEAGDLAGVLVRYVQRMASGRLADCDEIVASLIGRRKEVADAAQQLMGGSSPRPELSDMPPAVVKGYLKQLLGQL